MKIYDTYKFTIARNETKEIDLTPIIGDAVANNIYLDVTAAFGSATSSSTDGGNIVIEKSYNPTTKILTVKILILAQVICEI